MKEKRVNFNKSFDYLLLVTSYCNQTGLSKLPAVTIIWGVSLVHVPRNNDRDPEVPEIQNRTLTTSGYRNKRYVKHQHKSYFRRGRSSHRNEA